MPLISAKEYKERKGGGNASLSSTSSTSSGLISAKEFKNKKASSRPPASKAVATQLPLLNYQNSVMGRRVESAAEAQPVGVEVVDPGGNAAKRVLNKVFKDNPIARAVNYIPAKMAEYAQPDRPFLEPLPPGSSPIDIVRRMGDDSEEIFIEGTNVREDYRQRNPVPSSGSETFDKVGDFVGMMTGPLIASRGTGTGHAVNLTEQAMAKYLPQVVQRMSGSAIGRAGLTGAKMAPAGALENVEATLAVERDNSPLALAESAAIGAAGGAVLGAAGSGLVSAARFLKDRNALNSSLKEFITKTEAPSAEQVAFPSERIIQEAGQTLPRNSSAPIDQVVKPETRTKPNKGNKKVPEPAPVVQDIEPAIQERQVPDPAGIDLKRINDEITLYEELLSLNKSDSSPIGKTTREKLLGEYDALVKRRDELIRSGQGPSPEIASTQDRVGSTGNVPSATRKPLPPFRDNYRKPLSEYADILYSETSPKNAINMIPGSNSYIDTTYESIYFSNNRDLAIGQGNNKGVLIEFEAGGIQGQVNTNKPTWEVSYQNGDAEFIAKLNDQKTYQQAVKSVTITKDAKMDKVTKAILNRTLSSWGKIENPDGSVTFIAPKAGPKSPDAQPMQLLPEDPKATGRDLSSSDPDVKAYAGNILPFRQAATQSERTISRNQVIKNMRKNLGVVIDTGKLKMRGAAGIYKVKPEVIRSRMAEDIQVISHEIGHHLDKKFKLQSAPGLHKELVDLVYHNPKLNASAYQPDELVAEGIAEYVRLRLTDPQQANKLAPNFSRYFEAKLDEKTLGGLAATERDIDTWITQGDYEQAKGLIDFESGSRKEKFNWSKAYTRFVDDLNPIKLAEEALRGAIGVGKNSIYKMARLSRGIGERAKMAVTRGIYDDQGRKISEGLAEIVKPLEKLGIGEKDFATYLAVKHAVDLKKLGKRVPFDDNQIAAVLNRLDTSEVQAVHKKVMDYNNALLDILVDAQILSSRVVREMRKKYPNYVPFLRYFDDDAVAGFKNGGFGGARGFANLTNPVKRMTEEGSTRTIINPIESMIKNTFLVMNAAAKNKVGLQLAELSKIDGAGAWVEHLGKGGRDAKDHIITVWQRGEKQQYKIREPELYNAMLSLDAESTNSLLRFLGGAASMLRAGATLTPEFTIRNMMRDVLSATVNSTKYGFNPLDFFKGLFHVLKKTEVFDQFISTGGAMSTLMSLDRDANREAMKAVFKLSMKDKAMNVITDPKELAKLVTLYTPVKSIVGGLRKAAEISELSTKVGQFNKVLKKTGSMEEAAFEARDLMDFNRAGSSIRQANKAIAFLNASIQGTDRMARAFKQDKISFMLRSFVTLVLPSIGLHYLVQSLDPETKKVYDNIPQWQKDTFYIVPIPGTDEFARIPKPFETGMLFSTGTERIMTWLQEKDPKAFDDFGFTLAQTFTPPMLITALTPLLEAITNHSFFRDAPIVPVGEQRLESKDQYGITTSDTMKLVGEGMSMIPGMEDSKLASPRILENTYRGYTAGLGMYGLDGLDLLVKAIAGGDGIPQPEREWTEWPIVRSFTVNTSGGGQIREDFYEEWDKLSKKKASADRNREPFYDPEYGRMKAAKSVIDDLIEQYKFIQKHPDMKPAEKRSKLDELDAKMNDIAAKGLGQSR
jgi:hypothetical protein